jgi:thioester reductase-like protein
MNLPLEAARSSAVGAAENVLHVARRLAEKGRLAKVEVVSTVGVAGRKHRLLPETWVGAEHAFHNTYEQAKAEAEQLFRRAIEGGLALTVHRPSMVIGDSRTGRAAHFQVFYYLVEFLSGRRTHGIFPALGTACLDIIPADVVAEAIVRSSRSPQAAGRILHLCAGKSGALPLTRLQTLIRETLAARGQVSPRPRFVPRAAFRMAMRALRLVADARTRSALDTLPIFLDYLETDQAFDDARTAVWLAEQGVVRPGPESYLPAVLNFYLAARDARAIPAQADTVQYRRS